MSDLRSALLIVAVVFCASSIALVASPVHATVGGNEVAEVASGGDIGERSTSDTTSNETGAPGSGGDVPVRNTTTTSDVYGSTTAARPATSTPVTVDWDRTYGDVGFGQDAFWALVSAADGGYLAVGETTQGGTQDILAVRLDANGDVMWRQTIGGSGVDIAYDATQTAAGNFLLVGDTNSRGAGSFDAYVVKLSASGSVLQKHTYGNEHDDFVGTIHATDDGNYLLAGERNYLDSRSVAGWALKIAPNGERLWSETIQLGDGEDSFTDIVPDNTGYLFVGRTSSVESSYAGWVERIGTDGTRLKTAVYDRGTGTDVFTDATRSGGRTYIIGISNTSNSDTDGSDADVWITAVRNNLTEAWNYTYGDGSPEFGYAIAERTTGHLVVAASSYTNATEYDLLAFEIGPDGAQQWNRRVSTPGNESVLRGSMIAPDTGTVAAAGYRWDTNHSDALVVQLSVDEPTPNESDVAVGYDAIVGTDERTTVTLDGTNVGELTIEGELEGWVVNETTPDTLATVPAETPHVGQTNETWGQLFTAVGNHTFDVVLTAPSASGTYNFTATGVRNDVETSQTFTIEVANRTEHSSGVSQRTFDAVAGTDGTLSRQDTIVAVQSYISGQPVGGVTLTREAVLDLVRYYIRK